MKYNGKEYNRLCFLDTETTDVYWSTCAPIQLAAIITDGDGNIIDTFNEKIRTTHSIRPSASEVHGIYAEDLVNCRNEIEVLTDFCTWIKANETDVMVTYNGETFDRPMLNARCIKLGIPFKNFDKNVFPGIDARALVMEAKKKNLFNLKDLGRKWQLGLVAAQLGLSTENAHDALADVEMLKGIFFKLDSILHPDTVKRSLLS